MGHPDVNQRTIRPCAPRGNQRRPLSALLAGRVCGGARAVRWNFRRIVGEFGSGLDDAEPPLSVSARGQRVNSAEKGEIVDSGRRDHRQNWNGSESDGTRAEDGDSSPATSRRWRRATLPTYPYPPQLYFRILFDATGIKSFRFFACVYYTYGSYDVRSWQWSDVHVLFLASVPLLFTKFLFFTRRCVKIKKNFLSFAIL